MIGFDGIEFCGVGRVGGPSFVEMERPVVEAADRGRWARRSTTGIAADCDSVRQQRKRTASRMINFESIF